MKRYFKLAFGVLVLMVLLCNMWAAVFADDSVTISKDSDAVPVCEKVTAANIDPSSGDWGIFNPDTMTVSGLYENISISKYIDLLKGNASTGDVVVLKNGVEQISGCLEEGMIIRCYVSDTKFFDYTIIETLSLTPLSEKNKLVLSDPINERQNGFCLPLDQMDIATDITSSFGYRYHPLSGEYKLHSGIDIAWGGILGTPIKAVSAGTVTVSWDENGYGNYIMIDHGTTDGERIQTLYAHMSRVAVSTGQNVIKGQTIGYVGSTGASTGPHLHFEVREGSGSFYNCTPVDPIPYISNAHTPSPSNDGTPIGHYDGASGCVGAVRVYGWAFDRDEPSTALRIHVYIGGPAGSADAVGYSVGPTFILRNDVNELYNITGNHGFDYTIQTTKRGEQEVYVYAINVGDGANKLLEVKTVSIPTGQPIGHYDGAVGGTGTARVYGWAFDYDESSTALRIHVYIGGPVGSTEAIGYSVGSTSILRNDVNELYNITGNHGFDYTIQTTKRGEQEVYVYAINVGGGGNTLLGNKTIVIT